MAKEFAKKFYNSDAWHRTRDAFVAERIGIDGGMCQGCGLAIGEELHHKTPLTPGNIDDAGVTLARDNLEWLCRDCHFKRHRELLLEAMHRKKPAPLLCGPRCYFGPDGELHQARVVIVWGSPGSGKSRYVREHMGEGDLVVDLDLIKQALSMRGKTDTPDNLLPVALRCRDAVYDMIAADEVQARCCWVIAALPRRAAREALASRLRAELHCVDASYRQCVERVLADDSRGDKQLQLALVDEWWSRFEP